MDTWNMMSHVMLEGHKSRREMSLLEIEWRWNGDDGLDYKD